jgi:hypothetical protein
LPGDQPSFEYEIVANSRNPEGPKRQVAVYAPQSMDDSLLRMRPVRTV